MKHTGSDGRPFGKLRAGSARPPQNGTIQVIGACGRPRGFLALGIFLIFGATMAAYAAITLLLPGTVLDTLWRLNKPAHAQLAALGKAAGLGFTLLSAACAASASGWFRRRYWGWLLATTIVVINATGDLINAIRGEWLQGAVGAIIAGLLLFYLTSPGARRYFQNTLK